MLLPDAGLHVWVSGNEFRTLVIGNSDIFTEKTHWKRGELLAAAITVLKGANIEHSARNVEWMLCELLACNRAHLLAYPEEPVSAGVVAKLAEMIRRRSNREPLQYILGHTEFLGHRINVTPAVLIPRPETEWIVDEMLRVVPGGSTWLDVGTGSGCIPISIKLADPTSTVFATDVSEAALEVARGNADVLGARVHFFIGDMLAGLVWLQPD